MASNTIDTVCEKTIDFFVKELSSIRTGRATPSLVEHLVVDYYGAPTPLQQLGTITAPEPRLLLIEVWDQRAAQNIEKAILQSKLGLNPVVEGQRIRIPIPSLTEERRQEFVKTAKQRAEHARVGLRTIREEHLRDIKRRQKDGALSEDAAEIEQKELQKRIDHFSERIDSLLEKKMNDILTL